MLFTDLGLAEPLLRAVREQGYDTPTPIQAQAIPQVLKGGDLNRAQYLPALVAHVAANRFGKEVKGHGM